MDLRTNSLNSCIHQFSWNLSIFAGLCLFSSSIAISNSKNSKALDSGTSGSIVCTSVCLTSLTPRTFNSGEKLFIPPTSQNTAGAYNEISLLIPYYINSRCVTLSLTFSFLLFVSGLLLLAFRYSIFCFLKCLLVACITLLGLPALLWSGSCNHCNYPASLDLKILNILHQTKMYGMLLPFTQT